MANKKITAVLLALHLILVGFVIFWYVVIYEKEEEAIPKLETIDFMLSEQENEGGFGSDTFFAIKALFLLNASDILDQNCTRFLNVDDDADGVIDEDPYDDVNNDGDLDAWGNELIDEDPGYIDWNGDSIQDTKLRDFLIFYAISKIEDDNSSVSRIYECLKILDLIDSEAILSYNSSTLGIDSTLNLSDYLYNELNKSKNNDSGFAATYDTNSTVYYTAKAVYSLYVLNRSYSDSLEFIKAEFSPIYSTYFFSWYVSDILLLIDVFEAIDELSFFNTSFNSEGIDDDGDGEVDEDDIDFSNDDGDFLRDEDPAAIGDFDSDGLSNTIGDYILYYVTYREPDIDELDLIYISYKLGYDWVEGIDLVGDLYTYKDSDGLFEDIEMTYYALELLNHYDLLKID